MKEKGFIDISIVVPILCVLGLVGYTAYTHTDWSDLPWWVYLLLVLIVAASVLLPSGSAFPNALNDDRADRRDEQ